LVCLVTLVHLVYLVCLVCLVDLVHLVCRNQEPTTSNQEPITNNPGIIKEGVFFVIRDRIDRGNLNNTIKQGRMKKCRT